MKKIIAPMLALSALGVTVPEVIPPRFVEVPSTSYPTSRKTGIAAARRAAKKRKNKRR